MTRAAGLAAAGAFAAGVLAAVAALALGGAFGVSGPTSYADAPDEEIRDALRTARDALTDGRPAEAERIYRDLAAARPLDANARMMLGIHLQDVSKDPFGAIGLFQDFLRLAPDSEKADMVRERIHACELAIAKRTHAQDAAAAAPPEGAPSAAATARIKALSEELATARGEAAELREALADVRAERDRLERDNNAKQKQIDALAGRGSTDRAPTEPLDRSFDRLSMQAGDMTLSGKGRPSPGPSDAPNPDEPPQISNVITYEVKRGDTLWKIAQKAYNDGSRTAEIKAANPGKIGADGSVREGTVLRIPL